MGQNSSDLAAKFRGAILGLALGDALGTTLEFTRRDSSSHLTDIVGGGPFNLDSGQWTDDTSMALCLMHSLLKKGYFDAQDQMKNYALWKNKGAFSVNGKCFDIGITVSAAISKFEKTGEPYAGSSDPETAGNGSLMRLAPVPLFYFCNLDSVIKWSGESSRTTHGAAEAISACQYFSALIYGALRGVSKDELIDGLFEPAQGVWSRYHLSPSVVNLAKNFSQKSRDEIKSTGYVIDTLEAALWAFAKTDNFKDGAILAVNLGGDADTIGAVYGQLAGAYYGEYALPASWIQKLWYKHFFYLKADELLKFGASNYFTN
ncbi:MAG: ADP-ribosylglycohydrolase [Cellvibrio sp. 79]|nr:MAG: ADP-ribosylglycohydrolase [Cellvibrio sp. 79]